MSFRNIQPHQQQNTVNDIVEYEEPAEQVGIFTDMARVYIPQSGKKRSVYNNRLTGKRDPVPEVEWQTVTAGAQPRIKQLLEDVIVVERRLEDGSYESREFLQFKVIPLTSFIGLVDRSDGQGKARVGKRQMWKVDEDPKSPKFGQQIQGEGAGIACSSPDGVAPYPSFVGTTAFRHTVNAPLHPKFKRHIPIGQRLDGSEIPAQHMCRECPFNDWSDGKPPCGTAWDFIGWAPAQIDKNGDIMEATLVIIGGPYSVQAAFAGQKAGSKWGHDKRNLPKWDDLTKSVRSSKKYVSVAELQESQYPLIIGFASDNDKYVHLKGRNYVSVKVGTVQTQEDFDSWVTGLVETSGELDKVAFVEIEEKAYAWAPEGLNGPIYPLEVISVINNNLGSEQRVPMITGPKDDNGSFIFEPLEPKEVQDFFYGWHTAMERRRMWETQTQTNIAAIEEKRRVPNVTVSGGEEVAQIPAETIETVDDLDE